MEKKDTWVPIPEELLKRLLGSTTHISLVCPSCRGNLEDVVAYPYAYDPDENEVVYAFRDDKQCGITHFLYETDVMVLKIL